MFDPSQIRAISLDLDDTLWPVWPTIHRAEAALLLWLKEHAGKVLQCFPAPEDWQRLRQHMERERPDLRGNLSALRQAVIARALQVAGEDEALAMPAFEVFYAQRQQVQLFEDALPALQWMAQRWPVVAITNGNADVHRVGIGQWFQGSFSLRSTGFLKPDVRIFQCAADSLGLRREQILHIGDDPCLDALAARDAGMPVIWLNREGVDWPHATQPAPMMVRSLSELRALWDEDRPGGKGQAVES